MTTCVTSSAAPSCTATWSCFWPGPRPAITEYADISIEKFKDRFSPGSETAGGWRDLVFNGRFVDDPNEHKFEIQVHLDNLCGIRNNMGTSGCLHARVVAGACVRVM